jgi:cation diffusion facilitator CzcD-associated flavoprotein CzcO
MPAPPLLEPRVVIVIGAGSAGLKAALKLAVQGMRVSVFERQPVPSSSTPSIYAKLLRFPGVRVAGGVEVIDMWVLPNRHAVRGVRALLHGREHGEFFGDLVIDATKSPRFDQWRGAEGFARVNEIDRVLEKGSRGAA